MFGECTTTRCVGSSKAVTKCEHCGTAVCLDCLINWRRGGGDGGKQPEVVTQPEATIECHECDCLMPMPDLFTSEYWTSIGITDFTVQCMIISAISTGAMMHWK